MFFHESNLKFCPYLSKVACVWRFSADIDNDGDQDVVAASYDGNRVTWYENTDGEGTFSAGVDVTTVADNPT